MSAVNDPDGTEQTTPSAIKPVDLRCETCGRPARVTILDGYIDGRPTRRHLCLGHAGEQAPTLSMQALRRGRPTVATLLAVAGGVGALLGLFGDSVSLASPITFGWWRGVAVAAGGLIIFVGALLRADFVALGGTLLFIGGLCADWLTQERVAGLGIKQQGILAASAMLLAMPLFARCWRALVGGGGQTRPRSASGS